MTETVDITDIAPPLEPQLIDPRLIQEQEPDVNESSIVPFEEIKGAVDRVLYDVSPIPDRQEGEDVNKLEALDNRIKERSERALRNIEFEPTEELGEAVKGFYTDHLTLQDVIQAVADQDYTHPIFDRVNEAEGLEEWERQIGRRYAFHDSEESHRYYPLEAPNARTYSLMIANYLKQTNNGQEMMPEARLKLLRLCGQATYGLFTESSVGVSTLEGEDIEGAAKLADRLINEAGTDELYYMSRPVRGAFRKGDSLKHAVQQAQEEFWNDTRYAGQLLFHGTSDMGPLNVHGLMPRNEQVRRTGDMRNGTSRNFGGDTMHSDVPHMAEYFGMGQYSFGHNGGTVAIPFIKFIQQAPFARDAKFGIVRPGSNLRHKIPTPTLDHPIGASGAGAFDRPASTGKDRVFFASNDETGPKPPDEYAIELHDKKSKPATFIIDRSEDRRVYETNGGSKRDLHELGVGYGFPERLIIEEADIAPGEFEDYKAREARIASLIQDLQKVYLKAYENWGVCIPLRRGVFAQNFEGVAPEDAKGRPGARIYNKYTPGTGQRV